MTLLTWTIDGPSGSTGGKLKDPSAQDVAEKLGTLRSGDGSLTLDLSGSNDTEKSLQVLADAGRYIVTLGYDTDDDYEVRSFNGPKGDLRMVEIGGNLYRSDSVCADHSVVSDIVLMFLKDGDVPANLLS